MRRSAAVVDLVVVLVFVGIGRHAHDHGLSAGGVVTTAWPFLSGLAVGWFAVLARHRNGVSKGSGIVVWVATVTLGMTLRVVSGQGIAFSFILVASSFLGLFLLGWRAFARRRPELLRRSVSRRHPSSR